MVEAGYPSVRRVVVVGAGLGGHRTVLALRNSGYRGLISLVGDEDALPYDRPPLSKQALQTGSTAPALSNLDQYRELGVALHLGNAAVHLDSEASVVALADGSALPYDALVIATGSRARTLPFLEDVGALTLRTEADASTLRAELVRSRRLAVIGGGFVGCEVASSARTLGLDVSIIEALPSLLMRGCGPVVGGLVRTIHENNGVKVLCDTGVVSARRDAHGITLGLSNGEEGQFDVVVVGIGGYLDLDWLATCPLVIDDGIICDASGQTSIPNVFAVGDVARWRQPDSSLSPRCEHWTATVEQAAVVAHNIANSDTRTHDATPYIWSDQFSTKVQVVGRPNPEDTVEIVEFGEQARPVALYSEGLRLTGAVGIGAAAAVVRLRRLFSDRDVSLEAAREALGLGRTTSASQ